MEGKGDGRKKEGEGKIEVRVRGEGVRNIRVGKKTGEGENMLVHRAVVRGACRWEEGGGGDNRGVGAGWRWYCSGG